MFFLQTSGGVYIISFTTVIEAPVGIPSASFTLIFSLNTRKIKILRIRTRNNNRKDNKIHVPVNRKLNSIEIFVYRALSDMEIGHEELTTILNEKDKHEKMKEDIRTMKSSDELNKEKGKKFMTTELFVKTLKMHEIKKILYFNVYKIGAETFAKNFVDTTEVNKTDI